MDISLQLVFFGPTAFEESIDEVEKGRWDGVRHKWKREHSKWCDDRSILC